MTGRPDLNLPLTYPDRVSVGARIAELAADRFLMHYRVVSQHHGKVAAEGDGRIVSCDDQAKVKSVHPEALVARIRQLEGAALVEAL